MYFPGVYSEPTMFSFASGHTDIPLSETQGASTIRNCAHKVSLGENKYKNTGMIQSARVPNLFLFL